MIEYAGLPDDESPDALLETFLENLRALIPGWAPSDASVEVAIGAAAADEGATLYTILRAVADDVWRGYGEQVEGIIPLEAGSASAASTWTAADADGHTVEAGTMIGIDTGAGVIAVEVIFDTEITAGSTSATVLLRAVEPGSALNGQTGTIVIDEPPFWLSGITLDSVLADGTDGETAQEYDDRLARNRRLASRAIVLPEDVVNVALGVTGIERAMVIDNYDADTDTSGVAKTLSVYAIDSDGADASPTAVSLLAAELESRREANFVFVIGTADRTDVAVAIEVATEPGADVALVEEMVEAAIRERLSPARHGRLPTRADDRTWKNRKVVHLYEVADAALVGDVEYVNSLTLNGSAANLTLTGVATLPHATTVAVTVVDVT